VRSVLYGRVACACKRLKTYQAWEASSGLSSMSTREEYSGRGESAGAPSARKAVLGRAAPGGLGGGVAGGGPAVRRRRMWEMRSWGLSDGRERTA